MDTNNNIELRSEKVRNIVGEIPSSIMRYGLYIVIVFISVILLCLSIIPVYDTYTTDIIIKSLPEREVCLSPYCGKIKFLCDDGDYVKEAEIFGTIQCNDTIYSLLNKASGTILLNVKNNSQVKQTDIICEFCPDSTYEIYGEVLLPLYYCNMDYHNFEINIVPPTGKPITGKISHIYKIPIEKGNQQFLKANVAIKNIDNDIPVNIQCKLIIISAKKKLISKILK